MDVYTNGTILTLDKQQTAQALAVDDSGRIAACGNLEQVQQVAGSNSHTIDLDGACLMPGLIDPHSHFSGTTQYFTAADVSSCTSFEQIAQVLREFAQRRGWIQQDGSVPDKYQGGANGAVLIGVGLDHTQLVEHRMPDSALLNSVSEQLPIVVNHVSGHNLVANTCMFRLAHIDESTPDPEGGSYGRNADGSLNGQCVEPPAMRPLFGIIQSLQQLDMSVLLADMQQLYASYGITTVQDGATTAHDARIFAEAALSGHLSLDLVSYPMFGEDCNAIEHDWHEFVRNTDLHHFRFGGRKLFMDGSPQARTAWMSSPYSQGPEGKDWRSGPNVDLQEARRFAFETLDAGKQLLCHCNGDQACEEYLQILSEYAQKRGMESLEKLRPVMIHCQFIRPDQIQRMKRLGVIASLFASHAWYWGDTHITNLGFERASHLSPAHSVLQAGVPLTFHTDTPVILPNLWEAMWCAVTRVTSSGRQLDTTECISIEQALRAVTVTAAWQYDEESSKGTLSVGKRADMIIVENNPLDCGNSPEQLESLRNMRVLSTIKDGTEIWHA